MFQKILTTENQFSLGNSEKESKIFKRAIQFNVLPTQTEVIFNGIRQFVEILNQTSSR